MVTSRTYLSDRRDSCHAVASSQLPGADTFSAQDWARLIVTLCLDLDWGYPKVIISDRDKKFLSALYLVTASNASSSPRSIIPINASRSPASTTARHASSSPKNTVPINASRSRRPASNAVVKAPPPWRSCHRGCLVTEEVLSPFRFILFSFFLPDSFCLKLT